MSEGGSNGDSQDDGGGAHHFRTVLLVRHGESVWNAERRIQGQSGSGLTARGHEQVAATAAHVASEHPNATVVVSDLQRTVETVAPLEALLGIEAVRDERLRERNFGRWEGLLSSEVAEQEPERFQRWADGEQVVPEVGGESDETLAARSADVVLDLLDGVPHEGTLVCVTHGGVVHHGTHRLVGLPKGSLGGVANAGVTRLCAVGRPSQDGFRIWLDAWNGDSHLPADLRTRVGGTPNTSDPDADDEPDDVARAPEPPPVGT